MNKESIILLVICVLSGCHTSTVDPSYASHANVGLAAQEGRATDTAAGKEMKDRLLRLWADRPEYIQILNRERGPEKLPRLISSVPPSYPTVPYLANIRGRVLVSFVVSENGAVEDARVYESSDSRFDSAAIDSVRRWRFLAAIRNGSPTKEIITIPLEFDGRKSKTGLTSR